MSQLREFKTPGGYFLVVDEQSLACGVYRGKMDVVTPEQIRISGVKVTGVVFLGAGVQPLVGEEGLSLLPVRSRSIAVPYRAGGDSDRKLLQLNVRVITDQFPVYVRHFSDVRGFLRDLSDLDRKNFRIVILGPDVPRIDSMGVRVAFPHARIFQAKSGSEQAPPVPARVRAADLIDRPGMDHVSRNPVYMARVFLRRLDYAGMERLPVDYDLSSQDVEFIRAFIDVMFKNDTKNPELSRQHERIGRLSAFFRMIDLVIRKDREGIDREVETGIGNDVASRLLPFLRKQRERARGREEEIALWELEYRLGGGG
ncbi:hypothetical protein [Leptonema illini]|uniref:Uncharacterized protein n=1 Tax=Leptonema illini DSM 21528 TaxID=929563 RepID=H2CLN3_9LEPT|nr:hypothetical protein [Leptonema illini]EHQ04644.1 hypothetical protein Lepil_4166 [Leptonema illini DSM 21528]